MATAAQIAANRANAQKSTGPKTDEGKAASARNALKHGLCAEKLLIDHEVREEFEELWADYFARHCPMGLAEARLVDRIAQLAWRRDRGSTMEAAAWRGHVERGSLGKQRWREDREPVVAARATPIMNGVTQELLRIAAYEGRMSRELQRLNAELEKLQYRRRYSHYTGVPAEPPVPAAPQDSAGIGFVPPPEPAPQPAPEPAPEAPAAPAFEMPPADASIGELQAWTRRERARLDAEARAFHAAHGNPAKPAA